jgi:chemotaxis protein MotB
MSTVRGFAAAVCGLVVAAGLVGCQDAKDMQITALQEKLDDLQKQNDQLRGERDAAMADAEAARRRALQLQQLLDEANRRLAEGGPASGLPPGWTGTETIAWTDISDDILFDAGQATLKGGAKTKLQEVVATIKSRWPDREVWVVGHTDSDPIKRTAKMWADNLDLSCNRAMTVVREMWNMGLERGKVCAAGMGEYKPKDSNQTKVGKAQNRRVQVIAVQMPLVPSPETSTPARSGSGESGASRSAESGEIG